MSDKVFRIIIVILLALILGLQAFQFIANQQKALAASRIYAEYINSAYLSTETDRIAEQQLLAEETQIRLLSMLLGHSGDIDSELVEDLVIEGISAGATLEAQPTPTKDFPYEVVLSKQTSMFSTAGGLEAIGIVPAGTTLTVLEIQSSLGRTRALVETMDGLIISGWINASVVR